MTSRRRSVLVPVAALGLVAALAPDPAAADETAPPEAPQAPVERSWTWLGDLQVLGDRVRDLPGGREDLERSRVRLRGGIRKWFGTDLELTVTARASLGTDGNDDNTINFDNEKSDDLRADQLSLRWLGRRAGDVVVGKSALLVPVGELLWDADLAPVGAGYRAEWDVRALDTIGVGVAWAHPDHPLERGSDSRLGAVSVDWRIRDGAPTSAGLSLSWVDFSELDRLPASGLARTNRIENGRYASEFEVVDLRLVAVLAGHGRWPVRIDLDSLRNLGAARGDEDWGGRAALTAGRLDRAGHWEVGLDVRRIQRDAVLAAFNSDSWWFHTATRGVRGRAAYAIRDDLRLSLAATSERRDDLDQRLRRIQLELTAAF